nr:hypothetical protein [Tanacetum cinerariifolium]
MAHQHINVRTAAQTCGMKRHNKAKRAVNPTFFICCQEGKVRLPKFHKAPPPLNRLLDYTDTATLKFRDKVRVYNIMFCFTSFGAQIDHSINTGRAPYTFRINGQNYHRIGSLLPEEGIQPRGPQEFAELMRVNKRIFSSFKEACFAYGLFNDDKEWTHAISEAIIPKGKRADVVHSCINRSDAWKYFKVFTLTQSMMVNEIDTRKQDFNKWVLAVGDGTVSAKKGEDEATWIEIPNQVMEISY